jgi:hypothetical protein
MYEDEFEVAVADDDYFCMHCGAPEGSECEHLRCPYCQRSIWRQGNGCEHLFGQVTYYRTGSVNECYLVKDQPLPSLSDSLSNLPSHEQLEAALGDLANPILEWDADLWDMPMASRLLEDREDLFGELSLIPMEDRTGGRRYDYFAADPAASQAFVDNLITKLKPRFTRLERLLAEE